MDFKGKNVLLTGATSGIGKSLLFDLLNEGANIAFCGRSANKMEQLILETKKFNTNKTFAKVFDLTNNEALHAFIGDSYAEFGNIDVLINCAGANTKKAHVLDINLDDLDYMMNLNFRVPVILMQEIGKKMKTAQHGTIVNILSSVCLFSNETAGSYTASKSAFDGISKIFNKEMREHNVRVVSVYPGGTDTDFRTMARPDYMAANEVSKIIMANLKAADHAALDTLVFRPMVEKNFG